MKRKLAIFGLCFAGAELFAANMPPLVLVPAAALLLLLLFLSIARRSRALPLVLGAVAGLCWFCAFSFAVFRPVRALAGQTVTCMGTVETDATAAYQNGQLRGTLTVTGINGKSCHFKMRSNGFPAQEPGETFTADFTMTGLPKDAYRASRLSRGILLQGEYTGGYKTGADSCAPRFALYRLRKNASALLRRWLPRDLGGLEAAMLLGDKAALPDTVQDTFRAAGISHLLAVSGLHTGIVFALVNLLLWWLPLLRRGHLLRNLLAAACIWIYVAAAGFPPSAVRAAVMFTMLQSALASASEYNGLNALAAAAFGMLLWNPAWLGDISFQLSFAAVAAILAWGVPLCRRLRTRRRALNPITDALAVSLAATLATAPLVSHTFGIVPLAGVVVNPAAILLGSVVLLDGALWMLLPVGWAAPAFECVLSHTAEGLNALARVTADLPCAAAEYALGGGATAAVYLFFALATVAAWSAEPKKSVHLPA